jgi:uncharacterized repeat protein (TIGR03847 family)
MGTTDRFELGELIQISAVAVGAPGKRTFFLVLGRGRKWIRAWLEKEMLEAMIVGIQQLLSILVREGILLPDAASAESGPDILPAGLPLFELEIEQIAQGYEREKVILEFSVHALGPKELDWSILTCWLDPGRLKSFGVQAAKVCAAGRPRCALCGLPIDPEGHVCPKSN